MRLDLLRFVGTGSFEYLKSNLNFSKKEKVVSEKVTVFYAWQSDSRQKGNRNLIGDALNKAVEIVNKQQSEVFLEIDHDTKGVAGTPHITEMILRKIDKCGIFFGDISFVGESWINQECAPKLLPNFNVLIELGYAMARKDSEQIVLVQNDVFGSPERLPFDMGHHRWPIQYTFNTEETDGPATARNKLTDQLAMALGAVLKSDKVKFGESSESKHLRTEVDKVITDFHKRLKESGFCGMDISKGCLCLSVVPEMRQSNNINLSSLSSNVTNLASPIGEGPCLTRIGGRFQQKISIESDKTIPPHAATELTDEGVIFAASTKHLYADLTLYRQSSCRIVDS